MLLHWLWRWVLWIGFLWRISRLPLALRSTHPGWIDQMLYADRPVSTFYDVAIAFVLIAVAVSHAPACVFVGVLYRVRKSSLARYGALAQRYVAAFDARWIDARGETALGAADISGLADLGSSYRVIPETRVVPGSRRSLQVIVAAALVPMLPLVLIAVDFGSLLERLAKALV